MTRVAHELDCLRRYLEQSSKQLRELAEKHSGASDVSQKLHELARKTEALNQNLGGEEGPSLELTDT